MKRHIILALALGTCATMPLLMSGCGDSTAADAAAEQAKAPEIKVFPIQQREVTDYGEWFGYVKGQKDTDIHPHVSGFLVSQDYKDGTRVKEGDVLFRIDPALFEAELARAKANEKAAEAGLASAEATREKAQLDVSRYEQLVKTSAVSEKDLDDARQALKIATAAVEAAKASVSQNKAAVARAQIDLDYTVVRAPYDGIVGTATASQGDLVGPATKLANIVSADPMRVDFSFNSVMLIPALKDGKTEKPSFDIVMEDGTTYGEKGHIRSMESKVADNGLIDVEGEIPNPDGVLRGGMPVRVKLPLHTGEALLVPQDAIRTVLRNNFIIVVDKAGVPHMLPVTLGATYDIPVTEADGYTSEQKFVAVSDYGTVSLEGSFRKFGYDKPTEVPVVADPDNGMRAMGVSSANSRLPEGEAPKGIKTQPLSFRPVLNSALAGASAKAQGKGSPENKDAKPSLPPFPVKVTPLLCQDVEIRDEWFGSLRGVEETDIRPHVSGFLKSQDFKDGAIVKKGDVLFTIDPAPFIAERDEAKANLEAAIATRDQAKAKLDMYELDYERYRTLNQKTPGAISEKTVTDAYTAVQTTRADLLRAEATIAQTQAALDLAEINLGYTTITAPFDGRAGIRKASVGDLVSAEDKDPLVTLSSVEPMRVDFNINGKTALDGLQKFASMTPEARRKANPIVDNFDVVLEDGSVYPAKGHVVSADNTLSTSMGTLKVTGHIDNKDGVLRSGMPVRVRAGVDTLHGAVLVPARAPYAANGMDWLILLRPDNAPAMLPITKGPLVYIPVTGPDGKAVVQPMQVVNFDRSTIAAIALDVTKAQTLEDAVLGTAGVKDWGELLLKRRGAESMRALAEKNAGSPLADDAAPEGDWGKLVLKQEKAPDFRTLVLRDAQAADEVDLIAQAKGYATPAEMVLQTQGIPDIKQARVVAEGAALAAMAAQKNQMDGAPVNKLTPVPFQYTVPQTVVPSITAEGDSNESEPGGTPDAAPAAEQPAEAEQH